ncbi:MAG: ATP-binding protein [Candidatus Cloacimonetes bacterium]|nr:ATP-binding protein [Candidatus Cloacimonadota bacterium]MDY0336651.1 ATP-binding protein [Candidatus Cloacimonadaceae bacterium]MCB5269930.1 ATP-binding protein [Candidatus Cloacimonadota bacterium]MCK9334365.1 ATP-binding protein [Candidatus Cloacimonadota bacterium]MDD2543430.1 ATP-binding protein [Candidatus Cloacimonadota bacterium]
MIQRAVHGVIQKYLHKRRAIIIYGARRTGKTTLLNSIRANLTNFRYINCDLIDGQEAFDFRSLDDLLISFGAFKYILIDEAQRILDVGIKLKAIIDALPDTQIFVTGSSSLDLSNLTNEPLTGRKFEFTLPPLSSNELYDYEGITAVQRGLNIRLIYGNYPEVYLEKTVAEDIIKEIAGSYLFKDILIYQDIKRPDLMKKLLIALALQLGSEVSYTELANSVGMDKKTVERYISLMEQCFIIYRLGSYRRNLRSELKRAVKVYFWDNGIRNALINNFSPPDMRNDIGALWENYYITERRKMMLNRRASFDHYFWRTTSQQEIDLIEIENGALTAFEIKWNPAKRVSYPLSFTQAYPEATLISINPRNYLQGLIGKLHQLSLPSVNPKLEI